MPLVPEIIIRKNEVLHCVVSCIWVGTYSKTSSNNCCDEDLTYQLLLKDEIYSYISVFILFDHQHHQHVTLELLVVN